MSRATSLAASWNGAGELAGRGVGAALALQGAGVAVGLAGAITDGVVGRILGAWDRKGATVPFQLDAARAAIGSSGIVGEVAREGPVLALGLVDDGDVGSISR